MRINSWLSVINLLPNNLKKMKKVLKIFIIVFVAGLWLAFADDDISILPGWDTTVAAEKVEQVSSGGKVWENYRDIVENDNLSLWDKLASGIMDRDTILDYCVYLVKFLWEVALLIWAAAIIFLWYKRITRNVFWEAPKWLTLIIIWLLIVIFSYVIVKLIWSAFIS